MDTYFQQCRSFMSTIEAAILAVELFDKKEGEISTRVKEENSQLFDTLQEYISKYDNKDLLIDNIYKSLKDNTTPVDVADHMCNILNCEKNVFNPKVKSGILLYKMYRMYNCNICGRYIETNISPLANLLLNNNVEQVDNIYELDSAKYEGIISDIRSLPSERYANINYDNKYILYPISTNNCRFLLIQAIIYKLKKEGSACILLPNHNELSSRYDHLHLIRRYLLNTCSVNRIEIIPEGVILHFTKMRKCNILNMDTKKCTFPKNYATEKVSIYENYTPIKTVNIEDIIINGFSLNPYTYLKSGIKFPEDLYKWRSLTDLCNILPKSKNPAYLGNESGKYPFFTQRKTCDKYCDTPDYDTTHLILSEGCVRISDAFSASDQCIILSSTGSVPLEYIYYYLHTNDQLLSNMSRRLLIKMSIPVPEDEDSMLAIIDKCKENDVRIKELQCKIEEYKSMTYKILGVR